VINPRRTSETDHLDITDVGAADSGHHSQAGTPNPEPAAELTALEREVLDLVGQSLRTGEMPRRLSSASPL
jgi:hypothetical protein